MGQVQTAQPLDNDALFQFATVEMTPLIRFALVLLKNLIMKIYAPENLWWITQTVHWFGVRILKFLSYLCL